MENESIKITTERIFPELVFTTSRSSGPGGQNVNKLNTKVTVKFHVSESSILNEEEKQIISEKLATRISKDGFLVVTSQEKRSQLENREEVLIKLDALFRKAFEKKKTRKKTKPSKSSKESRIKSKKQTSEKKKWRQKPM